MPRPRGAFEKAREREISWKKLERKMENIRGMKPAGAPLGPPPGMGKGGGGMPPRNISDTACNAR